MTDSTLILQGPKPKPAVGWDWIGDSELRSSRQDETIQRTKLQAIITMREGKDEDWEGE